LTNVERFHAFVKTIVNNEPVAPFSMDLTKDMDAEANARNGRVSELVKELSRLKYGQDQEILEDEIVRRARL
jgi:hypothetical protein